VAPQIYEIPGPEALTEEVFGPILHVARYKAADTVASMRECTPSVRP
jgi:delta 1-pyrroline-5-carboxylate dehydrogenase